MADENVLVAYKTWRCKFCPEVRTDPLDMWRHLSEKHGIRSVETGSTHMFALPNKWDGILYTKGGTLVYPWHFPTTFAKITTIMTKGGIEFEEFHK